MKNYVLALCAFALLLVTPFCDDSDGEEISIEIEFTKQDASAKGESDGSINITVLGGVLPYTYQWSNGEITEDLNNVPAGNYSVVVTDDKNNTAEIEITISEPDFYPLAVDYAKNNVSSVNGNDGEISLEISGGTPPYNIKRVDGLSGETLSGLTCGIYRVTVTDANNLSVQIKIHVNQPIEEESFTDANGYSFKAVKINGKFWMAENMQSDVLNSGIRIQKGSNTLGGSVSARYYTFTNSGDATWDINPVFYNWHAARDICPEGWHVPSNDEWSALNEFLKTAGNCGNGKNAGEKLMGNESLTGFNCIYTGFWDAGSFYNEDAICYYWSSTQWEDDARDNWIWGVTEGSFSNKVIDKKCAMSVRCVKDE